MKKLTTSLLFLIIFFSLILVSNATTCRPAWDGTWVATASCSWPQTYDYNQSKDDFRISWNIEVGNYTVTLNSGDNIGIDLSVRWIKFANWKINLSTTSKIEKNAANTRYYIKIWHSNRWKTRCPDWMKAFRHDDRSPRGFVRPTSTSSSNRYYDNSHKTRQMLHDNVNQTWRLYCGTIGQRWQNTWDSWLYNDWRPGSY